MKKMKLYMLLLLVPLVLMGCVEKGKPASGINVEVDSLGGYTWEQLTYMSINVNNYYSIRKNIDRDLKEILTNTYYSSGLTDEEKNLVISLISKLELTISNIEDKTINVPTTISSINQLNSSISKKLGLFTLSELEILYSLIDNAIGSLDKSNPSYIAMTDEEKDELFVVVPYFINKTIENIKRLQGNNTSKLDGYNVFYSQVYDLLSVTKKIKDNKLLIENVLKIDIESDDIYSLIQQKIARIDSELLRLNSSYTKFANDTSDKAILRIAYDNLKKEYQAYNPLTPQTITNAETTFRSNDNIIISASNISALETKIDSVYSQIGKFSDSELDKEIKSLLNEYNLIKSAYTYKNYKISVSKSVNVSYIYGLLKAHYSLRIQNVTGILLN